MGESKKLSDGKELLDMTKIKIYAYYGLLAHEKQPVYSPFATSDTPREEVTVEIPFPVWHNAMNCPGVTIDGVDFLLSDVLTNHGDEPAIRWCDGHKTHYRLLKIVNS